MKAKSGLTLAMAAGCLMAGSANAENDRQAQTGLRAMKAMPVGHIYYNPATGERVVTSWESTSRVDGALLWSSINTDPCATGGTVGIIDDVDLDGDGLGDLFGGACVGGTFPCEGSWNNWWGDIAFNSVVDSFVTSYGISAPDLDADSDSIGDGIVGYDMTMTFSDNDNGFSADLPGLSGRSCILDLTIPTLAGSVGVLPPGFVAVYLLTIDFHGGASPQPSLNFELGDNDNIDDAGTGISGAALYGSLNGFPNTSGQDIDGDTLGDFSFSMRFDQSTLGTTGAPGMTKGANGFNAVADKLGNPGDLPADPADATGLFDALDIYSTGPSCPPSTSPYIGTFFFGGLDCVTGTPYASSYLQLYGPGTPGGCAADFDSSGLPADFTDVLTFLTDFGGACTDGIGNYDNSVGGVPNNCDFSDVIAFLTDFGSAACGN